jgi:protein-tyrosine phosphatase
MNTELFWIPISTPGRLAIMPRPRGGDWLEDEVKAWRRAGIDVVVSLLMPDEISELDLGHEQSLCEANGILFRSFPIVDRDVPTSKTAVGELASELAQLLVEGKNIAVHCRQGIGRAALIAICVLVTTGVDADVAIERVSEARGCPVPETVGQRRFVADFVKGMYPV